MYLANQIFLAIFIEGHHFCEVWQDLLLILVLV